MYCQSSHHTTGNLVTSTAEYKAMPVSHWKTPLISHPKQQLHTNVNHVTEPSSSTGKHKGYSESSLRWAVNESSKKETSFIYKEYVHTCSDSQRSQQHCWRREYLLLRNRGGGQDTHMPVEQLAIVLAINSIDRIINISVNNYEGFSWNICLYSVKKN
jgi:hypothetical protein